jgi:RDD family protein
MGVVVWEGDRVSTRDAVDVDGELTGARLRDAYRESLPAITFGLVRFRGNSLWLGRVQLLRFGAPAVTRRAVTWPIEGGLLARRAGGTWRIQATGRRVEASASGYTPRLPRPIYAVSHLQVHLLFTRLFLLRLRGREPLPGTPAPSPDRVAAATVDAALCFTLTGFLGRRRPKRFLAVAAIYHVICWSVSGRTLGGAVMRQRVVSVDGSRLTPQQAALRFALLPLSWIAWRPLHDRISGTTVVTDRV